MIDIDIGIPTCARPDAIKKTLASIRRSRFPADRLGITIIVDGNPALKTEIEKIEPYGARYTVIFNEKRIDWPRSINRALAETFHADAFLYGADDIQFDPECLAIAAARLEAGPEGLGGVVQIAQDVGGCSSAFGLMGRGFIDRFPGKAVMCPDYIHFGADFELGRFARRAGAWIPCPIAKVRHARKKDRTHQLAQQVKARDLHTQSARAGKGFLWGSDFNRIHPEAE